jgi:hypothetical protein
VPRGGLNYTITLEQPTSKRFAKKVPDLSDKWVMRKQVVNWKPIKSRNRFGEIYLNQYFPQLIDSAYRGELLFEIVSMTAKTSISFENAVNLVEKEYRRAADSGKRGSSPGHSGWYYENFIQWISDQGYSIDLSGDEFETALMCRVVA